ncbi:MAG: phosphatidylglycerophosphatase A [Phycisphaerales bacterium]|nr:phosphatidylglycerophosphatase A [Phycisphaerales bacterium]
MTAGPGGRDTLRTLCITVLGSGFAPIASGTWGSAVAVVLFAPLWFIFAAGSVSRAVLELFTLGGIAVACVLSIRWGAWAVARFGRSDPKPFVLDEFAGQWVALLVLPLAAGADVYALAAVVGGQFLLFRIFDVLKPPPARQLESLPLGWGILLDDLAAGVYANLVGQALWRLTPAAGWFGLQQIG